MRALGDRFVAIVLALGLIAAAMTGARADPYADALAAFAADSFDQTIDGINGIAASGNPLAATVIAALQEGRLLFSAESKQVFIREEPDGLIDAATGRPATGPAPADLSPVRLNNRLRRIVEAALGSLTLMAPDPGKRLEAAQAVFKSKDANAFPALDQAIAKETDQRVKQALIEASDIDDDALVQSAADRLLLVVRLHAERERAPVNRDQFATRGDSHADRGGGKMPDVEMDPEALIARRQKVLDGGERRRLHEVDHHRCCEDSHASAADARRHMLDPDQQIGRSLQSGCKLGEVHFESTWDLKAI